MTVATHPNEIQLAARRSDGIMQTTDVYKDLDFSATTKQRQALSIQFTRQAEAIIHPKIEALRDGKDSPARA